MSSLQTTLFSSEEMEYYNKHIHTASILTQKDDLKKIKFEMNVINERNDDTMDESHLDQHTLMPFMTKIEESYNDMLNQQSITFLEQRKQLNNLSMSAVLMKRINGIQLNAINTLADKLTKCKANEKTIQCHLTEIEGNEKCLEDALAEVESALADKSCENETLRATVRNCEHEHCVTRQQLDECTRRCGELAETVTRQSAELECRSNELDDERTNANRLKSALEYERESHDNQSKMGSKRIEDIQLQCDELKCQLDQEKLQTKKLASILSDMSIRYEAAAAREANGRRQQQQNNTCAPAAPTSKPPPVCDTREDTLKKKIKNLLKENETKDVRIKELKNKCCTATAAAAASPTKCHSRHAAKQEKHEEFKPPKCATNVPSPCDCHAAKIEKPSPQCAVESSSSTTTTICCANAKTAASQKRPSTSHQHPIGNYQAEVQKLLGEFDCFSRDVRRMYRNM